jgi:hypothetical protein
MSCLMWVYILDPEDSCQSCCNTVTTYSATLYIVFRPPSISRFYHSTPRRASPLFRASLYYPIYSQSFETRRRHSSSFRSNLSAWISTCVSSARDHDQLLCWSSAASQFDRLARWIIAIKAKTVTPPFTSQLINTITITGLHRHHLRFRPGLISDHHAISLTGP